MKTILRHNQLRWISRMKRKGMIHAIVLVSSALVYTGCAPDFNRKVAAAIGTIVATAPNTGSQLAFTTEPSSPENSGSALGTQPVVQVEDSTGALVISTDSITLAAYTNNTCTSAAGGSLTATTNPLAATAGVASFGGVTYTGATGTIYIGASAVGLTSACSTAVVVNPGPASRLALSTEPSSPTASGSALGTQPVVEVQDASGNLISTASNSITLAAYTNNTCTLAAGGSLAATTNPLAATAGVATYGGVTYTGATGTIYIGASTGGLTSACSTVVVVNPGPASKLAFSTEPSSPTASGSALGTQPVVEVQDASGNLVSSASNSITLAAYTNNTCTVAAGGSLTATTNPLAATAGVATYGGVTYTGATGTIYIGASTGGLTSACSTAVVVNPGPASKLDFSTEPSSPENSGAALSTQPVVEVQDASGNLISSASNSITLAAYTNNTCTVAAGGSLTATTNPLAATAGVATYGGVTYTGATGTIYIGASAGGLTSACSTAITINAGTAAKLVFSTEPDPSPTAGVNFATQPGVTVEDSGGNVVTTASNSITLAPYTDSTCSTAGAGTLSATTNPLAASSGVATFAGVNYTKSGSLYLKASAAGLTSACSSPAITVAAGPPAKLSFNNSLLTSPLVNACNSFSATVLDTYGNIATVTGSALTVNLTGAGSEAFYSNSTCTTATATATIGVGQSTSPTVYVTDTASEIANAGLAAGVLTSASSSVTWKLKLYITSYSPNPFTAGACAAITVTAKDFNGTAMAVPADSIFTIQSSGNSSFYLDNACATLETSATLLSGQSSMTLYTVDYRAETFIPSTSSFATYAANGPGYGTVTVNPAAPLVVVLTGPTYVTPGTCSPYTATSADIYGNPSPISGSALTVNLTATGSALLYSNAGCTTTAASVSIGIGSTSQGFYAQDAVTEISTVTGAAAGYTSGTFKLDSNATSNLQGIAVGGNFACAIVSGGVKCWGNNADGQLGNGTTTSSFAPVSVSGLGSGSGVTSVVAEIGGSACALKTDGSVWCWGNNHYGQLGNGNNTNQLTPVEPFNSGVSQISGGDLSFCAVTTASALYCWGYGFLGQLGLGNATSFTTPQLVVASGVVSVSMGDDNTCFTITGGDLECTGYNFTGQIGNGNTTNQLSPVQVTNLTSGITDVANGYQATCAVNSSGAVLCWGDNSQGQLGKGTIGGSSLTEAAALLTSGAQSLAGGENTFCALMTTGALKCWGQNNLGSVGDGNTTHTGTPQTIFASGTQAVSSTAANTGVQTCAIVNGNLQCWGSGNDGQLGTSLTGDSWSPIYPGSLE